ncbi:DNA polymerase III subunit delta' [Pragia fontium]|uniref:DNA polymerase III subunit delta' n=1 Tax=Pragia fontium DSM 5563 = ATCC 49100 TaxID=1122977 RepID=A0AAJ4WB81_9GAMM|nr:DNA polymerase III subunit delta' [Pragia fontium]SFC97072.1 DNA polymerase-3 subunit delta' [Pragia fontium DSM 5563 = ATCC 49100]VEJ55386.1 DNA polymerase III subunit delta' [Pragia fontium]
MIWYPWLTPIYRQLVSQYASDRKHHALLLQSIPGSGDRQLIQALGRWLMCRNPQGEKTCGICHSCNLMKAGTHPDWHVIEPEKGKSAIGVDRVRELTETLYNHAQQSGYKVAWFPESELLSEAAANALLKTLEEPPADTYFLLGCHEPAKLPATVRSRCLFWVMDCPEETFSIEWLRRQNAGQPDSLKTALRLSHGAPVAAQQLLTSETWKNREGVCQSLSSAFFQRDLLSFLPALNHDNADERIHWAVSLLLDVVKDQQGAFDFVVNQDCQSVIRNLAGLGSPQLFNRIAQDWLKCRHELLSVAGVNRELLLTNMLNQADILLA